MSVLERGTIDQVLQEIHQLNVRRPVKREVLLKKVVESEVD